MKANRATGWECGSCKRIYHDEATAEKCCRCECGRATGHMGPGNRCRVCSLRQAIRYNNEVAAKAAAQADEDKKRLESLLRTLPTGFLA